MLVVVGAGIALLDAPGASAEAGSAPLRIDVSTDVKNAKPGDVVTYTVHVRNLSHSPFVHLRVSHQLPAGFKMVGSTPRAAKAAAGPEWTVDLARGQAMVFSDTAKAGTVADAERVNPRTRSSGASASPDATQYTFTTTACALDGASRAVIACGGVQQALSDAEPGAAAHGWQPGLVGLGVAAAVLGAVRGRVQGWKERHGKA